MLNRRIEIKKGIPLNMGNYESERIDIGISGDIAEEDNLDEEIAILLTQVDNYLQQEVKEIKGVQ